MLMNTDITEDGTIVMVAEDLRRYLIYYLSDEYGNKINTASHPLLTVFDVMYGHHREQSIADLVNKFFYDGKPTDKLFVLYKELLGWEFIKHDGHYYVKDNQNKG